MKIFLVSAIYNGILKIYFNWLQFIYVDYLIFGGNLLRRSGRLDPRD